MLIECPQCGFSRNVPDDALPPAVTRATCPKCQHKFRFREPPEGVEPVAEPAESAPVQEAPRTKAPTAPQVRQAQTAQGWETPPEGMESGPPLNIPPPLADVTQDTSAGKPTTPGQATDEAQVDGAGPADASASNAEHSDTVSSIGPSATIPQPPAAQPPAATPAPKPPITLVPKAAREAKTEEEDIWKRLESMSRGEKPGSLGRLEDIPEDLTIPPPWEDQKKYGPLGGFLKTVRLVLLQPSDFFSYMPMGGGYKLPLVFYIIVGYANLILQHVWQALGMTLADVFPQLQAQPPQDVSVKSLAILLLVAPLALSMFFGIIVVINHMLLSLVRGANRGLEATLRGVAYGVAPMVLCVIPYVGELVGALWCVSATLIAFTCLHRAQAWRVILAFLLPVILASVAGVFLVLSRG